jgi:hypothetical protein
LLACCAPPLLLLLLLLMARARAGAAGAGAFAARAARAATPAAAAAVVRRRNPKVGRRKKVGRKRSDYEVAAAAAFAAAAQGRAALRRALVYVLVHPAVTGASEYTTDEQVRVAYAHKKSRRYARHLVSGSTGLEHGATRVAFTVRGFPDLTSAKRFESHITNQQTQAGSESKLRVARAELRRRKISGLGIFFNDVASADRQDHN